MVQLIITDMSNPPTQGFAEVGLRLARFVAFNYKDY